MDIQIGRVKQRLAEKHIDFILTLRAKEFLAEKGYDPQYGARPLRRVIQREILDPLAMQLLEGKFKEGDCIKIDVPDGKVVFERVKEISREKVATPQR